MTEPYRDGDGDLAMEDVSQVNTTGSTDNCYYVTAAKLSGMDVSSLVKKTEIMQESGGAPSTDAIAQLWKAAGLPSGMNTYTSMDAMQAGIVAAGMGRTGIVRFGVAFGRGTTAPVGLAGTGHMVVVDYRPDTRGTRFRDYQNDPEGPLCEDDVATGVVFHLFQGPA